MEIYAIAILLIIVFLYQQNNSIVITRIDIDNDKIGSDFDGYRILQISDLHSKLFGENQNKLVKKITDSNPDMIVVTGDTVDSRRGNEDVCIELLEQITRIGPVYLVTGNHESRLSRFNEFEQRLKDVNVVVLRNDSRIIKVGDCKIEIIGVDDPSFQANRTLRLSEELIKNIPSTYTILLSHRPELIDVYAEKKIDLVFSGHTHGGQIRLPFMGGLFAPDQGVFPRYTNGVYRKSGCTMLVSRGLGNSIFPQRIFNRPQLILATLNSREKGLPEEIKQKTYNQ